MIERELSKLFEKLLHDKGSNWVDIIYGLLVVLFLDYKLSITKDFFIRNRLSQLADIEKIREAGNFNIDHYVEYVLNQRHYHDYIVDFLTYLSDNILTGYTMNEDLSFFWTWLALAWPLGTILIAILGGAFFKNSRKKITLIVLRNLILLSSFVGLVAYVLSFLFVWSPTFWHPVLNYIAFGILSPFIWLLFFKLFEAISSLQKK